MRMGIRLISAFLMGLLLALVPPMGLVRYPGLALRASEPPGPALESPARVPEPTQPSSAAANQPIDVDPASRPDHTLPVPYAQPPDGTLQLPPTPSTAEPSAAEADLPSSADAAPDTGSDGAPAADSPVSVDPPSGGSGALEALPGSDVDLEALLAGLPPEDVKRSRLLMEADRLYLAGDEAAAQPLYRQAKESKWLSQGNVEIQVQPILDPAELPPGAAVYWREAQAGAEAGLPTRMLVPLQLLVTEYPEFLPGHALYARYLVDHGRQDEALAVLDEAVARYPYHPDLLEAQVEVQMANEQWIEAAITAQQFVALNPDNPATPHMQQLAQENLSRFRGEMNQSITSNLLANIVTGAAGYILTGGLMGPFTALNSSMMLLQGESAIGEQVANQVTNQLPMVDDPEIRDYVNRIGQQLADLAGRKEFTYEFEVIMDENLNAFALPGGKIFLNAGALTKTHSEAELAGLIGHEISHAVLSHGFQMVTQGNLTSSLAAFIPIPEIASITANLVVSGYSREMERQADILGTKILSANRYAADGLYNLMVTLREETGGGGVSWFASHPATDERVGYLKQLVDQGGFSRYAYEGVAAHLQVRQKMEQQLREYQLQEKRRNQ